MLPRTLVIRANSAASGKPGQPENITNHELAGNKVGELSEAPARLMSALAARARDMAPMQAANTQAKFDRWMQEQEENFQPDAADG